MKNNTEALMQNQNKNENPHPDNHGSLLGTVIIVSAILIFLAVVLFTLRLIMRKQAVTTAKRVVWYNDSGIYEYFPNMEKSDRITALPNDAFGSSGTVAGEKNPADTVQFSKDGRYAFVLKDFAVNASYLRTGSLYRVDLSAREDLRKDEEIGKNIQQYDLLPDGRLLYSDSDQRLYLLTLPAGKKEGGKERLGTNVRGYYLDKEKTKAFWYTSLGTGYAMEFSSGKKNRTKEEKRQVAGSVNTVQFASRDLETIYYFNADSDLLCIRGLKDSVIVDTDVANLSIIEKTGHAYYLKYPQGIRKEENPLAGLFSGERGTETPETAADTVEEIPGGQGGPGEMMKETASQEEGSGLKSGETAGPDGKSGLKAGETAGPDGESGLKAGETAGPDGKSGLKAGETAGPDGEPGLKAGETAGPDGESGLKEGESAGPGAEPGSDSLNGSGDMKNPGSGSGTTAVRSAKEEELGLLGYFDGSAHRIIMEDVSAINTANGASLDHDRVLVQLGKKDQNEIYLIREDKPIDTGLSFTEPGLVDLNTDYSEDILYYIRQDAADYGNVSRGTLYSRTYSADGLTSDPKKCFDNAVTIPAAKFGDVFTSVYNKGDMGVSLSKNGKELCTYVSTFFWDDTGKDKGIACYANVFTSANIKSGEFRYFPEEGEARTIAYGVYSCNAFLDNSYTFLTDYDAKEGYGGLVYWDGKGEAKKITDNAAGTAAGDLER